jgi:flagellar biosynthesis protein FlhA
MATTNSLDRYMKYSDMFIAVAVISIVVMMIIPLPTFLLDILLTFNISFSMVLLLVSMFTKEPLQLSVFPSLLLITTLLRLGLNVSATRLILLHAHAGEVIAAFGNFVVGGNPVVGFIVFIILVVIQFVVITKGAERVAEVAARFTLDAMPGKQMAIDADLNAGLITEADARQRRKKIQQEADFYGAMDGASKFVKGDAIAGIIITIVNIVGGFIIGVAQLGMSFGQALQTYTLLTVGDGLVAQIPALLISTATGMIVTRNTSEENLGHDVAKQILAQPKVLMLAGGLILGLGLVPGLPHLPFFILSLGLGGIGYTLYKSAQQAEQDHIVQQEEKEIEDVRKPENVIALLQVDPMELEIGYSLIPLVDVNQGGDLLDRIVMIRRQCALEMGLIVPTIRIRDNIQLKPNHYTIRLKGVEIASGEVLLDHYLAMNPGSVYEEVDGIATVEPAFGLPALWVHEANREKAELAGYTVVDPLSVVATHLTEVIKSHAADILGRQDVQTLLDTLKQNYPAIVQDLVPQQLSLGELHRVLTSLLRERISIRDMVSILETLADYALMTKDIEILTEYVRQALSRQISKQYAPTGTLAALALDPQIERAVADAVQKNEQGSYVALDPSVANQLFNQLSDQIQKMGSMGYQPIVLCSPGIRLYFRKLIERVAPHVIVLSYGELDPKTAVQTVGMVKLS